MQLPVTWPASRRQGRPRPDESEGRNEEGAGRGGDGYGGQQDGYLRTEAAGRGEDIAAHGGQPAGAAREGSGHHGGAVTGIQRSEDEGEYGFAEEEATQGGECAEAGDHGSEAEAQAEEAGAVALRAEARQLGGGGLTESIDDHVAGGGKGEDRGEDAEDASLMARAMK